MKIKADLAGQYYDQVRPIMTTDGTASTDLPSAEKILNYSVARKIRADLDATQWKPGR